MIDDLLDAPNALLRLHSVIYHRGRSKPQIYTEIKSGLMPPPIKMGVRMAAWPAYEIKAMNEAETAGATTDQMRLLVRKLVARRGRKEAKNTEAA